MASLLSHLHQLNPSVLTGINQTTPSMTSTSAESLHSSGQLRQALASLCATCHTTADCTVSYSSLGGTSDCVQQSVPADCVNVCR